MEPLPETLSAVQRLAEFGDTEVALELFRIGREVQALVPETVAISLGILADGLTFTLVASNDVGHRMDAVQYVDDGPCVHAMESGDTIETDVASLLDEGRWSLFARASSADGIESTLSVPIVRNGRVVAGVNLYASTTDAFEGHHDELAAICGGWSPGIVTNADLAFATRLEAVATPSRMQEQDLVDQAIGMLAASLDLDPDDAAERLRAAAARANITVARAAGIVVGVLSRP